MKKKAELRQDRESTSAPASVKPQSVKLQKYTVTSFKGDCKDWIRFWDQLLVEVDGSAISKIIKFNYLLELVTWGNLEKTYLDYMGDGYDKANKILNSIYGKDIKSVLHFYNKLARTVQTLNTTKKLDSAQCLVYTLMDKLG